MKRADRFEAAVTRGLAAFGCYSLIRAAAATAPGWGLPAAAEGLLVVAACGLFGLQLLLVAGAGAALLDAVFGGGGGDE